MIAGTTAGVISNIISHPLDTVKVRIQLSPTPLPLLKCVRDLYKFEGARGFFRGMASPVLSRTPLSAILFITQGQARRFFDKQPQLNSSTKHFLSGFFAGFCYTNCAFIFDLMKVRMQERKQFDLRYSDEIKRIYKEDGLKGFTRGYHGMLLRDGPGFGVYFAGFEYIKMHLGVSDKHRA